MTFYYEKFFFKTDILVFFQITPSLKIVKIAFKDFLKKSDFQKPQKSILPNQLKIENLIRRNNRELLRILKTDQMSEFALNILCTLKKKVKTGKVITYKTLADISGYPDASRAVGTVMANNPFPLIFPCHRVISSSGLPGNFIGNSIEGKKLKIKLLRNEGIIFDKNGKIPEKYFINETRYDDQNQPLTTHP